MPETVEILCDFFRSSYAESISTADSTKRAVLTNLLDYQAPAIRRSIELIVDSSGSPQRAVSLAAGVNNDRKINFQRTPWFVLHSLMSRAEVLSGQRVVYTPREFVESFRPLSRRNNPDLQQTFRVDEQKHLLADMADQILSNPPFLEDIISMYLRSNDPEALSPGGRERWLKESGPVRRVLEKFSQFGIDPSEVYGATRSLPLSFEQAMTFWNGAKRRGTPDLLWGRGKMMSTLDNHYLVLQAANNRIYDNLRGESISVSDWDFGKVGIVDPCALEVFRDDINPFLARASYPERIKLAQEFCPGNFTSTGIFVGNFVEYNRFLNLMGVIGPAFDINSFSTR